MRTSLHKILCKLTSKCNETTWSCHYAINNVSYIQTCYGHIRIAISATLILLKMRNDCTQMALIQCLNRTWYTASFFLCLWFMLIIQVIYSCLFFLFLFLPGQSGGHGSCSGVANNSDCRASGPCKTTGVRVIWGNLGGPERYAGNPAGQCNIVIKSHVTIIIAHIPNVDGG